MKMKTKSVVIVGILSAVLLRTAPASNFAQAPEFMSKAQAATWRAEQGKKTVAKSEPVWSETRFYTGKPLEKASGEFLYKFRAYDPELSRWTTPDPSGFPDGANNSKYVDSPISEFDFQGLKSVLWLYAFASNTPAANGPDASTWSEFQRDYSNFHARMTQKDSEDNPSPEYLSDGDFFEVASFSSVSQLSGFTPDKIFIMAHGLNIGTAENPQFATPPLYVVGGQAYTEAALKSYNSSIEMILGCGSAAMGGIVTTSNSIAWSFAHETADYLQE